MIAGIYHLPITYSCRGAGAGAGAGNSVGFLLNKLTAPCAQNDHKTSVNK